MIRIKSLALRTHDCFPTQPNSAHVLFNDKIQKKLISDFLMNVFVSKELFCIKMSLNI